MKDDPQSSSQSFGPVAREIAEFALDYLSREGLNRLKREALDAGVTAVDGLRRMALASIALISCAFLAILCLFSLLVLGALASQGGELAESLVHVRSPILWFSALGFTLSAIVLFRVSRRRLWLRASGLDRAESDRHTRSAQDPIDWDRLTRLVEDVVDRKLSAAPSEPRDQK